MADTEYVEIPLTRGKVALISKSDLPLVSRFKWYYGGAGYAERMSKDPDGKRIAIRLHRFLVGSPEGMQVDHINGDRLDNRRENLRVCTAAENRRNITKISSNTSGFRGVSFAKREQNWEAYLWVNNKKVHLGRHATAEEAARAFDDGARKYHGAHGRYNFPNPGEQQA